MVAIRMLDSSRTVILRFSNSACNEATEVTCDSRTDVSQIFIQYAIKSLLSHIFLY